MARFLRVTMPDSTVWDIPAEVIAENRTKYYSAGRGKSYKDGKLVWQEPSFKLGSKEWNDEFEQSMEEYELTDWAANNMDWKDVKASAVRVPQKSNATLYDDAWPNAEKRVVKHEPSKLAITLEELSYLFPAQQRPKDKTMEQLRKALEVEREEQQ